MTALMTVSQVAERLHQHPKSIREAIADGRLPAMNFGSTGHGARYRVDPRDLERWIESRRVRP